MEFILASNNQKKLAEMQRILSPLGIEVKTAAMLGLELPDVVEDGDISLRELKDAGFPYRVVQAVGQLT